MSKSRSQIVSIGTAVPQFRYEQQTIADFMMSYFELDEEASRKLSVIYHKSGIEARHSVLPDFHLNGNSRLFKSSSQNPALSERMNL